MSVPAATARAYLDAATAAPLHPAARAALLAAHDDGWADPHRLYTESRRARQLLDAARASVAAAIGCRPDELRFVDSSTGARQDGLLGLLAARSGASTAVASAVEHSALLLAAPQTTRVPVDRLGRVDPEAWRAAVGAPGVAAAALQAANHEVGTTQPVAAAADACAAAGVPLLVDATPLLPWGPPPPGWSVLVGGAEAWGGPPGVGVLAVRKGVRWRSPHPEPARPEAALPSVLAAAVALEAVRADAGEADRLSALVDRVRAEVPRRVPDVEVVGDPVDRLPHVVTFSCLYVDGEPLLAALDVRGFAVGSGSACTSSTLEPSHVLAAMGVLTHGNVRLSLHPGVGDSEIERFLEALPAAVAAVRKQLGVDGL